MLWFRGWPQRSPVIMDALQRDKQLCPEVYSGGTDRLLVPESPWLCHSSLGTVPWPLQGWFLHLWRAVLCHPWSPCGQHSAWCVKPVALFLEAGDHGMSLRLCASFKVWKPQGVWFCKPQVFFHFWSNLLAYCSVLGLPRREKWTGISLPHTAGPVCGSYLPKLSCGGRCHLMEFSGVEAPTFQDVAQTVGTALCGPRGLRPFRASGAQSTSRHF